MKKNKKQVQVYGQPFDLVLRIQDNLKNVQFFYDENVQMVLEDLLKKHKQLSIHISWWSKDLRVIGNTPVTSQEPSGSTEDSNTSKILLQKN